MAARVKKIRLLLARSTSLMSELYDCKDSQEGYGKANGDKCSSSIDFTEVHGFLG